MSETDQPLELNVLKSYENMYEAFNKVQLKTSAFNLTTSALLYMQLLAVKDFIVVASDILENKNKDQSASNDNDSSTVSSDLIAYLEKKKFDPVTIFNQQVQILEEASRVTDAFNLKEARFLYHDVLVVKEFIEKVAKLVVAKTDSNSKSDSDSDKDQ